MPNSELLSSTKSYSCSLRSPIAPPSAASAAMTTNPTTNDPPKVWGAAAAAIASTPAENAICPPTLAATLSAGVPASSCDLASSAGPPTLTDLAIVLRAASPAPFSPGSVAAAFAMAPFAVPTAPTISPPVLVLAFLALFLARLAARSFLNCVRRLSAKRRWQSPSQGLLRIPEGSLPLTGSLPTTDPLDAVQS